MENIYGQENPIESQMDKDKLQRVKEVFLAQQEQGLFPGGQLVVRRHGHVALNVACGVARGWDNRGGDVLDVKQDTPFPVYSTGKPMAAVIIAMLEKEGVLDIHTPICNIFPEFSGMGRDEITTLDVLTHKAGILLPDLIHNHAIWANTEEVWAYLLKAKPLYPRGTFAYMPAEYGLILDQIVRKLTGQTIAQKIHTLLTSLKIQNMGFGLNQHNIHDIAWSYWFGKDKYMIAGMDVADRFEEKNNDHTVFAAGNPAFSMVADAASLAAFYEFLLHGNAQIDKELIGKYTTKQVSGWNKTVSAYLSLGRGFMLGTITPSFYGWWGTG
ncbi:MAG: serine hydrolase domain-containing protein [Ghiorsea sp.]|nr:serine hydrolase domain-containing protein [Ghiorsea sp.]